MTIYIEQVMLTNFIIDFCILTIISKFIYYKPNFKRITLSAIFGSIVSLMVPYCSNWLLHNALKLSTSIIMLQIIALHKKQLISGTLLMLTVSYVMGGAILSNFGTSTNGGYVLSKINLIYVFGICISFTFIISKLLPWLKSKVCANSHIYEIQLVNNNVSINIKSFIDSGNGLQDENQPVSLINFETFTRLTNISISQYLSNQFTSLKNPHFINASTIAGNKKILVFTINELHIKNKIHKDIKIGVAMHFDNSKEYKAILNSSFYFIINYLLLIKTKT